MEEVLIQIIEDEKVQSDQLERFLNGREFRTIVHSTACAALEWLQGHAPGLAVLDINLEEDGIGYGVLNVLARKEIPVIVFTSRQSVAADHLASMYSGAIVYMRKPYNLHLMLVNIQNILQVVKPTLNVFGSGSSRRQITQGLWLDAAENCLVDEHQAGTVKIRLSGRQFHLAKIFLVAENRAVPRERIVQHLWGGAATTSTLYSTIARFNALLEAAGSNFKVMNVYRSLDADLSAYRFVEVGRGIKKSVDAD